MGAMVQHSGKGHYVEAQALKDAAMAWSIAKNWQPNTTLYSFQWKLPHGFSQRNH